LNQEGIVSKAVAIITARGGSKRIPRKNIKEFLGKPIIAYSITAALEAGCFDEVMVSTDDQEIAGVAQSYGAKVPFFRSAETSNDFSTTADVLVEVLREYQSRGQDFAYACCIYPTAPFVTPEKLKRGHELLLETGADTALPVVRFGYPIQRGLKIENGGLSMIWPEHLNSRSQDLMPAYHDSGQFYWLRVTKFLETRKLFAEHCVPIELPESEVQDIDTLEDWKVAEVKYRMLMG
jgi:N-acylneuraminate cytidylyltransferase